MVQTSIKKVLSHALYYKRRLIAADVADLFARVFSCHQRCLFSDCLTRAPDYNTFEMHQRAFISTWLIVEASGILNRFETEIFELDNVYLALGCAAGCPDVLGFQLSSPSHDVI